MFELFPRRLPEGRRYGVVAGVGRALDAIERFVFDDEILGLLREHQVVDERTLEWLAGYRFDGDVWGYAEGETYFPYSPLMIVESTFAEAVLLEISRWKYEPGRKNGQPVKVRMGWKHTFIGG